MLFEDDLALEPPLFSAAGDTASLAYWAQLVRFPVTGAFGAYKVGVGGASYIGAIGTAKQAEAALNVGALLLGLD